MDMITSFDGPTPGTAAPGNLYADLGSRTLWLGVEPAVDANQAVLISDIVGLQANINQTLLDAKAYTDTKILTRAPTVHTHTASQVTDFNAAVTGVVSAMPSISYLPGMVTAWAGSLAAIGTDALAGWALCDGASLLRTDYPALFTNIGTIYGSADSTHFNLPDLREKFLLGAGSRAVGSKNAATSFNTTAGGGHDHTVNGTAISIAQMPAHAHGTSSINSVDHTHGVNINSGTESADHSHNTNIRSGQTGSSGGSAGNSSDGGFYQTGGRSAAHYHNVAGNTGVNSADHTHTIPSQGGGATHTHTLVGGGGAHQHNITDQQLRDTLPFLALAYIIKL